MGRKSAFSAAQKSLGGLSEEDRRAAGKAANEARQAIQGAIDERREALQLVAEAALLEADRIDLTLPGPASAHGVLASPDDRGARDRRGVPPTGLPRRRGPGDRGRLAQLPGAQHPARSPRADDEGHDLPRDPGADRPGAADRDLRGADPHDAVTAAARAHRVAGPRVPARDLRRHAPARVPPGGVPGRRRGHHVRAPEGHARDRGQGAVRTEPSHPAGAGVLPVRGTRRRGRRLVLQVRRCGLPRVRQRVDRAARVGHGPPAGARELRVRQRAVHRLRVRRWAWSASRS